jgi:hypothetical protein
MNTKKYILLIFLAYCHVTFSQNYKDSNHDAFYFKFGPKFGLNLNADLNNFPNLAELAAQGNYQIGGFLQMGKKIYLQPEFYYAVQKMQVGDDINTYENFRVPVHVGLKILDIGLVSLHISGGAMYTLNKGDEVSFDTNKLEYQIGAGVDIFDFITTDIRYTLRKDKTLNEQIGDFQENGGVFNLTVGLKL